LVSILSKNFQKIINLRILLCKNSKSTLLRTFSIPTTPDSSHLRNPQSGSPQMSKICVNPSASLASATRVAGMPDTATQQLILFDLAMVQ